VPGIAKNELSVNSIGEASGDILMYISVERDGELMTNAFGATEYWPVTAVADVKMFMSANIKNRSSFIMVLNDLGMVYESVTSC
jgi:hypothetical protein